jgi:hypothetical protein
MLNGISLGISSYKRSGSSTDPVYDITNSIRLRAATTSYLSRTPGSAGNRKRWTLSVWVKGANLSTLQGLFMRYNDRNTNNFANYTGLFFDANKIVFRHQVASVVVGEKSPSLLLRDPTAWFHVVACFDTPNATAGSRMRIWVNGVEPSSYAANTAPAQNTDGFINQASVTHDIGIFYGSTRYALDGHLAEIVFADDQALTADSFGQVNSSGVWVPKQFTGSYGTTGFYLPFFSGGSLVALAGDQSGLGNNWTTNAVSLTAGVDYDQMTDTPTNNHPVLNPLVPSAANITKAGLRSGTTAVRATFDALAINSYWEVTAGASAVTAGVINDAGTANTTTVTANKTFGFRLSTAGALDYINITDGGSWTSITTGLTGILYPYGTGAAADWNFGQRPFSGSAPGGYAKLCAKNLTSTTVITSGTFTGNANADGPDVFLNGAPKSLTINGNAVTWGTHADKTAKGFKVRSNAVGYNAAGSNTYVVSSVGAAFKRERAQINP